MLAGRGWEAQVTGKLGGSMHAGGRGEERGGGWGWGAFTGAQGSGYCQVVWALW
jgi:hypothetical protein